MLSALARNSSCIWQPPPTLSPSSSSASSLAPLKPAGPRDCFIAPVLCRSNQTRVWPAPVTLSLSRFWCQSCPSRMTRSAQLEPTRLSNGGRVVASTLVSSKPTRCLTRDQLPMPTRAARRTRLRSTALARQPQPVASANRGRRTNQTRPASQPAVRACLARLTQLNPLASNFAACPEEPKSCTPPNARNPTRPLEFL